MMKSRVTFKVTTISGNTTFPLIGDTNNHELTFECDGGHINSYNTQYYHFLRMMGFCPDEELTEALIGDER